MQKLTVKERLNRTEAKTLITTLHNTWKVAQENMTRSQQRQAEQANKHRRPVDFGVGDKVWVTTRYWKCDRPSRKLSDQMSGPFEILRQRGHSYELKLPASFRVHPVFHANKLRKDPGNLLPR